MKKTLIFLPLLAMIAAFAACDRQPRTWNQEQRRQMRESLRDYRRMAYLENLSDAEFVVFSDDVATDLETSYPVYTTFIAMPGVQDTVDVYVVTTVVEELNADARNMRHIYPYDYLVSEGILPSGLDREQQRDFYRCLASKVDDYYDTMGQFFQAVLADGATGSSQVNRMQQQCASDLFEWTFTMTEIVEED